jgi:hypothetical protein
VTWWFEFYQSRARSTVCREALHRAALHLEIPATHDDQAQGSYTAGALICKAAALNVVTRRKTDPARIQLICVQLCPAHRLHSCSTVFFVVDQSLPGSARDAHNQRLRRTPIL